MEPGGSEGGGKEETGPEGSDGGKGEEELGGGNEET